VPIDWSGISHVAFLVVIGVTMLAGLLGLLTVVIPGLTIIWAAALVYGLVEGFTTWGWVIFAFMTFQMIVGVASDNVIMGASAKTTGASWLSIIVALGGGVVGSIAFPPFGGIIAALIGIFVVEWIKRKDLKKAWESFKGLASGCGWAVAFRFFIGCIMVCLWLVWVFVVNKG